MGVRTMTSLTDAYDRRVGGAGRGDRGRGSGRSDGERSVADARTPRRPYVGLGALVAASALVSGAIVLATSVTVATAAGLSAVEADELARVLCGLGLPLAFVGVLAAIPAPRRANVLAAIGSLLAICGLAAFSWAYPDRWFGDALDLTVPVVSLYALGLLFALLALAVGVLAFGREGEPNGDADSDTESSPRDRNGRTSLLR